MYELQVCVEVSPEHSCSVRLTLYESGQVHVLVTHAHLLKLWGSHRWYVAVDNNKGQWHRRRLQTHSQELHRCAGAGQLLHMLFKPFVQENSNPHALHRPGGRLMKDKVAGKCSQQLRH
jgi:hypothetical protein